MTQPLLVLAKSRSSSSKFEQDSLVGAVNLKDFLEQTGEFDEITIFQLKSTEGPTKEWVSLSQIEC